MGEEGVRALVEGGVGLRVEHALVVVEGSLDPEDFVERCARRFEREGLIVAGLPGGLSSVVSSCAVQAAYTYTAEDIVFGTRVRNRSLLFLMNLLGYGQVRDVINYINNVKIIIVVGPGSISVARIIASECGGRVTHPPECRVEILTRMARARLERYR